MIPVPLLITPWLAPLSATAALLMARQVSLATLAAFITAAVSTVRRATPLPSRPRRR